MKNNEKRFICAYPRLSMPNSLAAMAVVCVFAAIASAQATPHIGYVYPAGGQQGATFEVTIGGQTLNGAANVHITGQGIEATVIEHIKPITQGQAGKLRDRLIELRKTPNDPDAQKEMADIRKKLVAFLNRPSSQAIIEMVTLRVTVAKDAAPGDRELRLSCSNGLSNPLTFEVGQFQEFSKDPSWKIGDDLAEMRGMKVGEPRPGPPPPPTDIALPAIVNGQILPAAVDRFRFQAKRGQHIVIAVAARKLVPYIADAVPGWFQAAITLRDPSGKEVAHADHFRFDPDPVAYYEVPQDGQYSLDINDSIYRGREDFVYRATIGELPYITGIFPLGCHTGKQATVELFGWNLPAKTLTFDARDKAPGVYQLSARNEQWMSNCVPFSVDALPETVAQAFEPVPAQPGKAMLPGAQPITLPVIVNGRIEQAGKWDVFSFEGHAGEEVVAEVTARRLNSVMESVLKLTDASGTQLAFNDGCMDKACGLITDHADSYICTKLPADGLYCVHVGDLLRQCGPGCAYRLRISRPMPDFTLRLAPSTVNIRSGLSTVVTVYAIRHDGFAGDIDLALKGAPAGFSITGGRILAGKDEAKLTISGPLTPLMDAISLCVEGHAKIQGQDVIRPAVPAENMMQAFAYWHLVCAKELDVDVIGRLARGMARVTSPMPLKVWPGKPSTIQTTTPTNTPFGEMQFQLEETNNRDGIAIKDVSPGFGGSQITLAFDPAAFKPGMKGNLIVSVFVLPKPPPNAAANPNRIPRLMFVGTLPAITYEVQGATSMPTTQPSSSAAQK
jgi:hypothetical protein